MLSNLKIRFERNLIYVRPRAGPALGLGQEGSCLLGLGGMHIFLLWALAPVASGLNSEFLSFQHRMPEPRTKI